MPRPSTISFFFLLTLLFTPLSTFAQDDTTVLSIDFLTARLADSEPDAALSDTEKTEVLAATAVAREQLDSTRNRALRIAEYTEVASNSDTIIAALQSEIAAIDLTTVATAGPASVDTIRNELDSLAAERTIASAALNTMREEQNTLAVRGPVIATEIASIREESDALEAIVSDVPRGSLAFAEQSIVLARVLDRRLAVTDLQLELTSIPARQNVIEQRINLAELQVEQLAARIGALTEDLNRTRTGRAETAVTETRETLQQLDGASPRLQTIADENFKLAQRLNNMVEEQYEIDLATTTLREQILATEQSRRIVERVLATGRLTDELGILLRNVRMRQLPVAPLEQRVRRNEEARITQELNSIIWRERLQRLADPDAASSLISEAGASDGETSPVSDEGSATVSMLVEQRKALLSELVDSAQISRERLVDQAILLANIIDQTDELTNLLDRRLLWLRNQDPIARDWFMNLPASFAWLLNPRAWYGVARDLIQQIFQSPLLTLLGIVSPLLIWANRKRLWRFNESLAANVGHVGNDTYWTTPLALAVLCLLALPWPILAGAMAGILVLGDDLSPFSIALIPSLAALASLLFLLTLLRKLSKPRGFFEIHFQWNATSLQRLRTDLFWFMWVQCTATFIFTMAANSVEPSTVYSLGLLGFIVLSVGMSVIAYVLMNPMHGILIGITNETEPLTWQKLIFPLAVAAPLIIGITPLFGYFDTAVLLQSLVFQSGILLLTLVILHGLSLRMLKVAHRRFSLRQIRQIRARIEAERAAHSKSDPEPDNEDSADEADQLPDHVDEMSEQPKNTIFSAMLLLFCLGMWLIWRPLVPTVGIAEDIVLWQGTRMVDGASLSQGITLWNLCVALLFLFGGVYLSRNIRGFLEVGLFGQLTLDAGARYAAVSITGYIIVAVTTLIGLAQLGIDWSKMQWILAALGVGLGFGLQEIVANFVSGLIILFERPVRVGDIVSIGELTGTVSKISIRATTVMDFDNREVLLPNKSIITDNVVNWTLNNPVTRVVIEIGVAYGSDLNQVTEILLATATNHHDVLETPPPQVFLIEHGDSSIDYEMRVFVSSPPARWPVAHDLNIAINTAFAEKGIQIPFPQRDIHVIKQPA